MGSICAMMRYIDICGQNEIETSSLIGQKVRMSRQLDGVLVEVVQGDILMERQDLISMCRCLKLVNATFQCENSILVKELGLVIKKSKILKIQNQLKLMQQGEILMSKLPKSCACARYLLTTRLPSYMAEVDYFRISEIYQKCFEKIDEASLGNVSFVDLTHAQSKFPRQFNAELLIRQLLKFVMRRPTSMHSFKIINQDTSTTNIYLYELEKQIDENNNPELRRLRLTRDREESIDLLSISDNESQSPKTMYQLKQAQQ